MRAPQQAAKRAKNPHQCPTRSDWGMGIHFDWYIDFHFIFSHRCFCTTIFSLFVCYLLYFLVLHHSNTNKQSSFCLQFLKQLWNKMCKWKQSGCFRAYVSRQGGNLNKMFGVGGCPARIFCLSPFIIFSNNSSSMVLGPVMFSAEVRYTTVLPCETANFQGWGCLIPIPP